MIEPQILKKLVSFRRQMHMYPQSSFNQFQTRQRIKRILKQLGVKQQWWRQMAKTGLIVDIKGEAEKQGQDRCIAFRADIDALTMLQNNDNLEYKSKNVGVAHMCGHDGHTACLIAFVPFYLKHIHKIPKNKTVRLLFQPSQQGPLSGAALMIKQGCLQGVDEVYGFHNFPDLKIGTLFCKQGVVMSQMTILSIKITGTSGHASEPQLQKIAIWQAVYLYKKIKQFIQQLKKQKKDKLECILPVLHVGQRFNVISESAYMEGTIRSLEKGLKQTINQKILTLIKQITDKGFQVQYKFHVHAPMTVNSEKQTQHVMRVAEKVFGKQKIGPGILPVKGSQDFAYYTQVKPGAFFCLSEGFNQEEHSAQLHSPNYNFNDELIPKAGQYWYQLALDRLLSQN